MEENEEMMKEGGKRKGRDQEKVKKYEDNIQVGG